MRALDLILTETILEIARRLPTGLLLSAGSVIEHAVLNFARYQRFFYTFRRNQ